MNRIDGFDKLMKDGLENFEMPFDPTAWSAMEQKLDAAGKGAFESMIREKVEANEMPYEPSQWARLEQSLPSTGSFVRPWMLAASVIGIIGGGILLYSVLSADDKAQTEVVKNDSSVVVTTHVVPEPEHNSTAESEKSNTTSSSKGATTSPNRNLPVSNKNLSVDPIKDNPVDRNSTHKNDPGSQTVTDGSGTSKKTDPTQIPNAEAEKIPTPLFAVSDDDVCSGQEVTFSALNMPVNGSCQWEVNHIPVPVKGSKCSYTFTEAGSYNVSLVYIRDNNQSVALEKTILVKPSPQVHVAWEEKTEDGRPLVYFSARSTEANAFQWKFHDGNLSDQAEPHRFYRHKGDYKVVVNASAPNGCTTQVIRTVHIENDYNLFAPNAFSPNGDNVNNTFIPEALKVLEVDFVMNIYSRDGKLVYQTTSANRPWDGRYMSDNQLAPMGVYIWVVNIKGEDAYKGSVTLIRD